MSLIICVILLCLAALAALAGQVLIALIIAVPALYFSKDTVKLWIKNIILTIKYLLNK